MVGEPRLSQEHAEAVLLGALAHDASESDAGVTVDEIFQIAHELGISETAVIRSLADVTVVRDTAASAWMDRIIGPAGVIAERTTMRDPGAVTSDLHRRFERLNLTRRDRDGSEWVQRSDWWPDIHRLYAPVELGVATTLEGSTGATLLRLGARLDDARRNHVVAAGLGAALLPLVLVGAPADLVVAGGLGIITGAIAGYRIRLREVERCLRSMLDKVSWSK